MKLNSNGLFSILKHKQPSNFEQQIRTLVKVRLKWVKNRGLDHTIDAHTDLKAAHLLKDAINRSSTGFVTAKSISDSQKLLGLTIPTVRFIRRYPTLFEEFPHPSFTQVSQLALFSPHKICFDASQSRTEYLQHPRRRFNRTAFSGSYDDEKQNVTSSIDSSFEMGLGLPDDFDRNLVRKYPDHFQFVKASNGLLSLKLGQWREELAVSELQKSNERSFSGEYRQFKRGQTVLAFPMNFPRGYGAQKKVKEWMEEFQKLPYISPYEDSSRIDPNSELMEKRVVGVLHEFLSLTLHKKTKRNYLRSLREELNLPHKFTRMFTRYPGIFYLSLKCKTTTVTLKEGYRRGRLVDPHPLVRLREKFAYVMRTGLVYRNKGLDMIRELDNLPNDVVDGAGQEGSEDEEFETGDECFEEETSDIDVDSDEDQCLSNKKIISSILNVTQKIRSLTQPWVSRHVISGTSLILQIQKYHGGCLDTFFSGLSYVVSVPFYTAFLPLLFWSGHGKLARQMTLLMAFCDYLGNCLKDVVSAPRPSCPPVRRVTATKDEKENAMEYGLPSSHTLNTVCLSGYLLHYVMTYTQNSDASMQFAGFAMVCLFVGLIGLGRIYLGMHSLVDIIGGLAFGLAILAFWLNVHEYIDNFVVSGENAYCYCFAYPTPEFPTPSFEYHTAFNGVALGIVSGIQQTYHQFHHNNVPRIFTSQLTIPAFVRKNARGNPNDTTREVLYIPALTASNSGKKSDETRQPGYLQKLFFFSRQASFDVDTGIRLLQYGGLAWSVVDLVPSLFSHLSL
ncbi:ubiquitin carboxyl-terminal hydrolase family protein [Actinidia rufa]|uniref:Ubiquitin carboxyl-terminal hydrolase family protein n=1 Tax=Actinidia rufa TaxID=165716 RepID=A0A7J0FYA9_9ERIC|nr:ubiquitin carboxyl-terminal hydrolase family protein [Actinidia rufa]